MLFEDLQTPVSTTGRLGRCNPLRENAAVGVGDACTVVDELETEIVQKVEIAKVIGTRSHPGLGGTGGAE